MSATLVAFVFLFTSSCTDVELAPRQVTSMNEDISQEDKAGRKKKVSVSVFSVDGRDYEFIYDGEGRLSSINASDQGGLIYQYIVRYDGDQFIAADLVENGQVMSSNRNFEFDKKGRIVAFDYVSFFYPDQFPEGLVEHNTVTYDKKGNAVQVRGQALTYDQHRNIIQWGESTFAFPRNSNPRNANPLNDIPDLWLVFVEEFGHAELMLSPQLSTSKTFPGGAGMLTTTYTHQYNEAGQLIRKTGVTNGNVTELYTFSY